METALLQELNSRFGVAHHVSFGLGAGGLPVAQIANAAATATIYLDGAHVAAFQPRGEHPVLWLSPQAVFTPGKPIRGGIPVCWPNFGAPAAGSPLPFHGFARIRRWDVLATRAIAHDLTEIRLGLTDTADTLALWPNPFVIELTVLIGRELDVELTITNPGPEAFTCTDALHTYFAVSNVAKVTITGLENGEYIDTTVNPQVRRQQTGPIAFSGFTDRVYTDTTTTCVIHDPDWQRDIAVLKRGSRTSVVWNPWEVKAATMADIGTGNWPGMLCVEAANAANDIITVPAGQTHSLATVLRLQHS